MPIQLLALTRTVRPSRTPRLFRTFATTPKHLKWEGRGPEEHTTREPDKLNVQHDASKEGKEERAKGDGSRGTSGKSGDSNKKAKEEFPEAPDTIGMQDERGGKN